VDLCRTETLPSPRILRPRVGHYTSPETSPSHFVCSTPSLREKIPAPRYHGRLLTWQNRTILAMAIAACSACAASSGHGATPELPHPDTLDVPMVIPDPVPVVPAVDLTTGRPNPTDQARARYLVDVGRTIRSRPDGPSASLDYFQRAVEADSLSTDALWELGWTLQLLERWNEALDAWERLRALDPTHPDLNRARALVAMRKERADQAAKLISTEPLPVEEAPRDGAALSVAAVGDIQFGQGWPPGSVQLAPDSAKGLFTRVQESLGAADITFGNLETVLADSGESTKCGRGSRNCYAFRAPTMYAEALRRAGFDVVSTNNNHAGDFGAAGRVATKDALDHVHLHSSGPQSGVASWESNGLRVALIAFATGDGPYLVQDIASARAAVIAADRSHDLVIVSFHGGAEGAGATRVPKTTEYAYGENRGDVHAFARAVVDAGADLVLGHGPHVLRGVEIYRGRLIAYSLGNFASWHGLNLQGPLGRSVILRVTLAINGVILNASIDPVVLEQPGIPTPDPDRASVRIIQQLSTLDFGDPVFDDAGHFVRRP
jgi:Bacterial capsule synthesis protein PGA_cap